MTSQIDLASQRDYILSVIAGNPDSIDPSLQELLDSINELIALEEAHEQMTRLNVESGEKSSEFDENQKREESGQSVDQADLFSAETNLEESLLHLQCRVPFQHSWGQMRYCNAMVQSVEATSASASVDEVHVGVLFLQPTHRSMVACEFFLDGRCRFKDDQCHFSHGKVYALSDLRSYQPPDFTAVKVGSTCLCSGEDGIWEHGAITEIKPGLEEDSVSEVSVRIQGKSDVKTVPMQQIVPDINDDLESGEDVTGSTDEPGSSQEEEDDSQRNSDDDEFQPHAAWEAPVSRVSGGFGGWETHTRGVGSKLMARMGFVVGQGLGLRPGGRTDPVPAHVLPKGKSLDYCMALKEGTDRPAVGSKHRRKRPTDLRPSSSAQKPELSIFDFLNKKLKHPHAAHRRKTPTLTSHVQRKLPAASTSSVSQTTKDSCKQLNLEALKVHDAMSNLTRELNRLQTSLTRAGTDRASAKVLSQRIKAKEDELAGLRRHQDTLQRAKDKQKERKSLSLF